MSKFSAKWTYPSNIATELRWSITPHAGYFSHSSKSFTVKPKKVWAFDSLKIEFSLTIKKSYLSIIKKRTVACDRKKLYFARCSRAPAKTISVHCQLSLHWPEELFPHNLTWLSNSYLNFERADFDFISKVLRGLTLRWSCLRHPQALALEQFVCFQLELQEADKLWNAGICLLLAMSCLQALLC